MENIFGVKRLEVIEIYKGMKVVGVVEMLRND